MHVIPTDFTSRDLHACILSFDLILYGSGELGFIYMILAIFFKLWIEWIEDPSENGLFSLSNK
jgi:hypothetical protein